MDIEYKESIKDALDKLKECNFFNEEEYSSFLKKYEEIEFKEEVNEYNESSPVILEVKNLYKKYKNRPLPAVDKISFKVRKGEFHAFIGANGAGKTTTIKAIVSAYVKWEGNIKIDNISNQKSEAKAKIGYVPEKATFPKSFNTYQYLRSMAILSGLTKKEAEKFTKDTIKDLKMEKLSKKKPSSFSSGQKKKILLAQALVNDPDILILDEPAANLDPLARAELFELLKSLQEKGKAIFISSHILSEIGKYANCTTILDGGKIVYHGKVRTNSDLEKLYLKYVKLGSVDNDNK